MQPFENPETRSFDYKKGLTAEDSRRKREDGLLDLRRANREEALAKRRQVRAAPDAGMGATETSSQDAAKIPALYSGIMSSNLETQFNCTLALRKIISNKKNPPIEQVIRAGTIPRLVEFLLREDNEKLVFEAAWILTNVASGTSENTRVLYENKALPNLVRLLRSPNIEIAEQVCWALSNVAGDSAECRDQVLAAGVVEPLLSLLLRSKRESVVRTCAWALSNLCRSKPEPDFAPMRRCLPFLADLVGVDDPAVVADAAWALSFICDENTDDNHKIQAVVDSGAVPRVVALLSQRTQPKTVRIPLLRIIGNIVTGSDPQTQHVIDNNGLAALKSVMASPANRLHKEAVWTCSNIAAGTPLQMEALVRSGIVAELIHNFGHENYEVKKEIAWVISNLVASGDADHGGYIAANGGLDVLCDLLLTSDPQTVAVALEGINSILNIGDGIARRENKRNEWADLVEANGGLDKLEQLQEHEDENIYNKSLEIVSKHYGDEDADLAEIRPEEKAGAFSFGGLGSGEDSGFKF